MFQKIMKISDKLMQLDQREGLRQAADLFESESYLDGYINTIQAIYDYSHNYKYLEKIADYFLEKQQFNIAFSYYNKYLKQKNNSFYEKFLRTFPIEVRIDETREAQNPVLLKLIDLNMVMVYMIIFAHSKKLYDAVIQLSENLDIIKKEIDNFLQGRINYGDDISEVYDDYRLLSDVLSNFNKDNTNADIYVIGHCARRFLDNYLQYKIPNNQNPLDKLIKYVKELKEDTTKYTVLYRIVNDESHVHPEILFDKGYLIGAIALLLDTIEKHDKLHYNTLKESCNISD